MAPEGGGAVPARPALRRVLGLGDLVFYGIVLITPLAPVGVFGVASQMSRGHVATTLLAAMVAMMLTAVSYGRMAVRYPAAGSAYTYIGKTFNGHLGFLAGWAMLLDYLIIPVINVAYFSLTVERLLPAVPLVVWTASTAALITFLNLRGIRSTARSNAALLALMSVVIGAFVVFAIRYVAGSFGWAGLLSTRPFYNPDTFQLGAVSTATSLAALAYIGFDGVTTLAEEAKDPKRTVALATVLTCLVTGLLSIVEVYLAQLVWPEYNNFPKPETAFLDVCRRAGGTLLFQGMAAILIVSVFGSGLAGQVGAARLLFGMGRDRVLPAKGFAYVSPSTGIPAFNVCLIGVLTFVAATALPWERAVEILNFGAFLSFMAVNAAAIATEYREKRSAGRSWLPGSVVPALGFVFCLWIWLSLRTSAQITGGCWLLAGVIYSAVRTRGFRRTPPPMDFS